MTGSLAVRSSSLFSRVAWGIVLGFLFLHGITLTFYNHEKMVAEASTFALGTAERALTIAAAADEQPELVELLSTPSFALTWASAAGTRPDRTWPHSDEVAGSLRTGLEDLDFAGAASVQAWYTSEMGGRQLVLQLPLADRWLIVRASRLAAGGHTMLATFWTTVFSGLILLLVLWATRRFTRTLPRLADAAEQVGRKLALPALPETGPREIRRLTRVFNAMQQRVSRLLSERNTMLGALSHDVRTLVTRLSLRLENLADDSIREKAQQDVAAIATLLDEALAFAKNEAGGELPVQVDLGSLLQSLIDDVADQGADAEFSAQGSLVLEAEATGLRRAFANLIDNALRYGGAVSVRADGTDAGKLRVTVTDPGPGIADSEQNRVLEPFVRLESSRNRGTGGSGLGLSIAQSIVERHNGQLGFERTDAGFAVVVSLPVAAS